MFRVEWSVVEWPVLLLRDLMSLCFRKGVVQLFFTILSMEVTSLRWSASSVLLRPQKLRTEFSTGHYHKKMYMCIYISILLLAVGVWVHLRKHEIFLPIKDKTGNNRKATLSRLVSHPSGVVFLSRRNVSQPSRFK